MASIYKRGNIWYIDYKTLSGKRIRKSLGTSNKKLAELKRKEIDFLLQKGKLGFSLDVKLIEFVERFLDWSQTTKAKNTYLTDKKACKNLIEYFENIKLSQIKLLNLEAWKVWLVDFKGLSKTTANIRIRHIKSMFSKAVEWQFLEENPAKNLKLYNVPKGKPNFLTEKEVKNFLKVVKNEMHLAIFYLLYLTGMRLSEAVNLTWEDIDFESRIIKIKNKKDWHTKNYKERHIPIHSKLIPHLEYLMNISENDKVVPVKYRYIEKLFQKYSAKSGVKASPHLFRHSIATAMASKGVSLQAIKEILGHSDYSTTLIYAKMSEDYKRKALEVVFDE